MFLLYKYIYTGWKILGVQISFKAFLLNAFLQCIVDTNDFFCKYIFKWFILSFYFKNLIIIFLDKQYFRHGKYEWQNVNQRKSAAQAYTSICSVLGDEVLSKSTCEFIFEDFGQKIPMWTTLKIVGSLRWSNMSIFKLC